MVNIPDAHPFPSEYNMFSTTYACVKFDTQCVANPQHCG